MPEQNVRFVVLGAAKADKEFAAFSRGRISGSRNLRELQRKLNKTNRETQRALRKLRDQGAFAPRGT